MSRKSISSQVLAHGTGHPMAQDAAVGSSLRGAGRCSDTSGALPALTCSSSWNRQRLGTVDTVSARASSSTLPRPGSRWRCPRPQTDNLRTWIANSPRRRSAPPTPCHPGRTICNRPSRSHRSTKIAPPWSRRRWTQPATVTSWPASCSLSLAAIMAAHGGRTRDFTSKNGSAVGGGPRLPTGRAGPERPGRAFLAAASLSPWSRPS